MLNKEIQKTPLLIVISAPSGTGKTTLCDNLCLNSSSACRAITCTTRSPRADELDGKDYYFLSTEEFTKKKAAFRFFIRRRMMMMMQQPQIPPQMVVSQQSGVLRVPVPGVDFIPPPGDSVNAPPPPPPPK